MREGRVAGKVALVAGGASGIGRASASRLAAEGATVLVADIDLRQAEAAAKEIQGLGGTSRAARLDVTDEGAWQLVFRDAIEEHGRVDVLVFSAGISAAAPTSEMSLADWRRVLNVNLDGAFLGTREALRTMGRTAGGTGGSIVHVSSASGVRAAAGAAGYSTSKAALIAFSRAVAKECLAAGNGIRVNTVCPGGVKTAMWTGMPFFHELVLSTGSEDGAYAALAKDSPAKRFAEPAEIAAAILYLASDESLFVTGTELLIDGGYTL